MTWELPAPISVALEVTASKEISAVRLLSADQFCGRVIVAAMLKAIKISICKTRKKPKSYLVIGKDSLCCQSGNEYEKKIILFTGDK